MEQLVNWIEILERLTLSTVLLMILFWIARQWIQPLVTSHMGFIETMRAWLTAQETVQKTQVDLLEKILEEEEREKASLERIERHIQQSDEEQ